MFIEKLEKLMSKAGVTQSDLANALGKKRQNVNKWFSHGSIPRGDVLKEIADYFEVSVDYLLSDQPDNLINLPAEDFNIPIYTTIKAGNGEMGITDGEVNGFISICSEYQKQKVFAIQVSGDSMATELHDGDIALFKPINGEPIREKDIFAVEIEGWSSWVVKFVRQDPSGMVQLISANPAYPVKEIDPKVSPVTLRGRLIESRRIRK